EVHTFSASEYVLRRTQVVARRSQIEVGFTGIGNIWSTDQLENIEQPPAELVFSISKIPPPAPIEDFPDLYKIGWLKKSPEVMIASRNRLQLHQEWWFGYWSTYLYDPYTPA